MDIIQEAYIESLACWPYVTAAMREAAGKIIPGIHRDSTAAQIRKAYACHVPDLQQGLALFERKDRKPDRFTCSMLAQAARSVAADIMADLKTVRAIDPKRERHEGRGSRDKMLADRLSLVQECERWAGVLDELAARME